MVIKRTINLRVFIFLSLVLILSSLPFLSDTTYYAVGQNQYSFSFCKQNLTKLEPGDIVFKFPDVFPNFFPKIIDHCLLFVEFDNSTGLYVFIEANVPNEIVQYVYETESSLTEPPYGPVARVKHANDTQKINAINFAKKQIAKSFQMEVINKNYNPEDTSNDSYANEWYCSELMWAAYYNCNNSFPNSEPQQGYVYGEGIDLDRNGWNKNLLNISIVAPREILFNRNEVSVFYLHNVTSIDNYFMINEMMSTMYRHLYSPMIKLNKIFN
ncbi:MAG: hypothetical protein KGY67_05595 [Candidatus Thermoplasmatota archaeon]|nr:hypothetical protein [Candidatus Thermoplasmatota archaeon]